jgi:hypothetical protein
MANTVKGMTDRKRQEQRILAILQRDWPNWTPAPKLAQVSLQYSRAVFSLRRRHGWAIENLVEVVNGIRHDFFRLSAGSLVTKTGALYISLRAEESPVPRPAPAIAPSKQEHTVEPGRMEQAREWIARALAEPRESVSGLLFDDLAPDRTYQE